MQFASKLRLSGGTDERMEVLQRLWQDGSDFNSPEMISVCVTLLQLKNRVSEVAYSDSEIFEFMLKCGLMPNIVVYNVLLQNSLEAGDHKTGWKIHDMMVENGIETDVYTYSLLLSDAKLRHDQSSIERIINIVSEKDIRNAHVVTDLLHAIFIYSGTSPSWEKRKRGRPSKTFERMLLVYRQYFHLEPLKRLIPWLESSYPNTIPVSNKTLMDAPIPALVVMLTALLRQLSEPGTVVQFYNHFCSLVQAADPVVKELSKSTHVYNIILKALGGFQDTLALCPRLIGDMLSQNIAATSEILGTSPHTSTDENQSSPQEYRSMHDDLETRNTPTQDHALSGTLTGLFSTEQPSDTVQAHPISVTSVTTSQRGLYPKPDVYTWSVLLKAFMDHGQPRAAEKVLAMMKDRGVWPNQVTWNKLIIGYARMQDMSMTVDSVNRLHKGGFDLDGFTMKGLAYFQNRRALIEAMKASETSDPEGSLKKQSAEIGRARTASNKTMKMVRDGLEPVADVTDEMRGTQDRENELLSSTGRTEREEEFVVRDIQRL
jgi:pentatricopeptide repeat protein